MIIVELKHSTHVYIIINAVLFKNLNVLFHCSNRTAVNMLMFQAFDDYNMASTSQIDSDSCLMTAGGLDSSSSSRIIIPAEVKRLISCHSSGETVLHKAARLGHEVFHSQLACTINGLLLSGLSPTNIF